MSPADHTDVLYWGLKFSEWISLGGIILGPIVAVAITLWIDGRRKRREQRVQVIRMLLTTRHLPSDPTWSVAINLIPTEFNDSKEVMAAWNGYIEAVRYKAAPDNHDQHETVTVARQTKLIYEAMKSTGFKLAETDIQTSAYAAGGFVERDNILIASQLAMADIAATLRRQTELMDGSSSPPGQIGQP